MNDIQIFMSLVRNIYDICTENQPNQTPLLFYKELFEQKCQFLWNESNQQSTVSKLPLPMQNQQQSTLYS